jgi:hypothetical protein
VHDGEAFVADLRMCRHLELAINFEDRVASRLKCCRIEFSIISSDGPACGRIKTLFKYKISEINQGLKTHVVRNMLRLECAFMT